MSDEEKDTLCCSTTGVDLFESVQTCKDPAQLHAVFLQLVALLTANSNDSLQSSSNEVITNAGLLQILRERGGDENPQDSQLGALALAQVIAARGEICGSVVKKQIVTIPFVVLVHSASVVVSKAASQDLCELISSSVEVIDRGEILPKHIKISPLSVILKLVECAANSEPVVYELLPILRERMNEKETPSKGASTTKVSLKGESETSMKIKMLTYILEGEAGKIGSSGKQVSGKGLQNPQLQKKVEDLEREKRQLEYQLQRVESDRIRAEERVRRTEEEKQILIQTNGDLMRQIAKYSTQPRTVGSIKLIIPDKKAVSTSAEITGEGVRVIVEENGNRTVAIEEEIKPPSIMRCEIKFINCTNQRAVGIISSSAVITAKYHPQKKGRYVFHNDNLTKGNITFGDGDVLMMEVNQQKHTLHFFVNGEQQPVFVQDIPAS
ncbi:MAG: hypothetical protein EZS28_004497, partial [Streblomastix strix]